MMKRRAVLLQCACLVGAATLPFLTVAQDAYPSQPIKVVVGFAAGGGADAVARLISSALAQELKGSIVIENKPGANANIATDSVARSAKDGYTLLYNTSAITISPSLYKSLSYDVNTDLVPIALTAEIPLILVTSASNSAKTLDDFIAQLKANPGKLNYASSSPGNLTHLAAAEFLRASDTKAFHIPYKSESPAVTDLIGGRVEFYIGNANTLLPQIKAGKLTPLAVTSAKRLPQLPEIPTLVETLGPGLEMSAWSGFMAPAGTPAAINKKLESALQHVITSPELSKQIADSGATPRFADATAYKDLITEELGRWARVAKEAGIQPE
jgi:tripartite-type tricarboxylate transporter receptor subunit TctC